jgi:hypothetical protein
MRFRHLFTGSLRQNALFILSLKVHIQTFTIDSIKSIMQSLLQIIAKPDLCNGPVSVPHGLFSWLHFTLKLSYNRFVHSSKGLFLYGM